MPITFSCQCGKTLRVADEHAGRRVKCPACSAIGTVPALELEPEFEIVEKAPKPFIAPPPATPKPVARPRVDDQDYDGTVYGLDKSARGDSDDDRTDEPHDKPLPDFRLGSGQRGKKRSKKKK